MLSFAGPLARNRRMSSPAPVAAPLLPLAVAPGEPRAPEPFPAGAPHGRPVAAPGGVELCADAVVSGWVADPAATHVDVVVNETRHEAHTLFSDGARADGTGGRRRHFVVALAERLRDGDRVAVRLGGRDLAGSPAVMAPPEAPTDAERTDLRFHVETPNGPIENRLCTMSGWLTAHAGARALRLLVDGRPQDALFTVRPDVLDHFDAAAAVGWEFTCDVAALEAGGATRLRLACEVDGLVVAERDIALRLPPLVRERATLLLFMHVPKTAGTSLNAAIAAQPALATHWLYHRGRFPIAAQAAALSPRAFHDLDLVGGHFTYGLHERVGRPCRYVTVLREPLDFLRSYFFYRKDVQHFPPFRDLDVFAAMERRLDHYLDNCFTRCFVGMPAERPVDAAALAEAMTNMERHFEFVGLVERMEESVERLSGLLGVPLAVGRENCTPRSAEAEALDLEAFAERAAPYVRYDEQLYRHARRLFWD